MREAPRWNGKQGAKSHLNGSGWVKVSETGGSFRRSEVDIPLHHGLPIEIKEPMRVSQRSEKKNLWIFTPVDLQGTLRSLNRWAAGAHRSWPGSACPPSPHGGEENREMPMHPSRSRAGRESDRGWRSFPYVSHVSILAVWKTASAFQVWNGCCVGK